MKKNDQDIDEKNEGLSYERGREFEEEFATFLKNELHWTNIRLGASMQGKFNAKGTTIDILGQRLDFVGEIYKRRANKFLFASAILCILGVSWYIKSWMNDGFWFCLFSILCFIGVGVFKFLSLQNHSQNSWTECKNLKSKVDINHIAKMLREINDFKATKNESYRFTHFYFASANGYVENALKMAIENNITCYVKKGNSFEEVKYWDR